MTTWITVYGVMAVTIMMVMYTLEHRAPAPIEPRSEAGIVGRGVT